MICNDNLLELLQSPLKISVALNCICMCVGESSMEIKTEVDSNDITESTHDDSTATGLFVAVLFSATWCLWVLPKCDYVTFGLCYYKFVCCLCVVCNVRACY